MPSGKIQTISERVDDVPVIVHWLLKMRVHTILDEVLSEPHGNRQGLSFGQLAVLFLTYMLTQYDHRMCPVEAWVKERSVTLERATDWAIGAKVSRPRGLSPSQRLSEPEADPEGCHGRSTGRSVGRFGSRRHFGDTSCG